MATPTQITLELTRAAHFLFNRPLPIAYVEGRADADYYAGWRLLMLAQKLDRIGFGAHLCTPEGVEMCLALHRRREITRLRGAGSPGHSSNHVYVMEEAIRTEILYPKENTTC